MILHFSQAILHFLRFPKRFYSPFSLFAQLARIRMSGDNTAMMEQTQATSNTSFNELVETLQQFDTEGKGTVHAAELRNILTVLGAFLSDDFF